MKKIKLIILLIVCLGAFLRFWKLSIAPVSLSMNEVAIAYNSYSILKTGKDEWNNLLPLAFRSVGDYKPPVLIYLMVPVLALFGLNEFSTRFTVAVFGVLTIPVIYFLIKKISKNDLLALLTAFSVAISPWHIQFSRATFEAIVALFFVLTGCLLFFVAIEQKGKYLWCSGLLFILSMYTYHAERAFTPLLVLGLLIIFREKLFSLRFSLLKPALLSLIFLIPFIKLMLSNEGQIRPRNIFISRDNEINMFLHKEGEKLTIVQEILDNNWLILGNFWAKRYLNYFDPVFLFAKGSKFTLPGAPDVGLLHIYEAPFFFFGLWVIFFRGRYFSSDNFKLIVFWFLVGPLVASLTNNEQHALRSLVWIPIPQLMVGAGMLFVWEILSKHLFFNKCFYAFLGLFVVFASLVYFFEIYLIHFPIHFSEYWDYGWKEAVKFAWVHQREYKEIVIDPDFGSQGPYTVGTPYLYVLFYGKYPPKLFQEDPGRLKGSSSVDFANFIFRPIYWPEDRGKKETLFIGSPWSLPSEDLSNSKIHKIINFKNGSRAFMIVEPL